MLVSPITNISNKSQSNQKANNPAFGVQLVRSIKTPTGPFAITDAEDIVYSIGRSLPREEKTVAAFLKAFSECTGRAKDLLADGFTKLGIKPPTTVS